MSIFSTDYEKNRKYLTTILNSHKLNGYGVEIGVKQGHFSKHLLSNWDCKKLYLVDPWIKDTVKSDTIIYDETHHDHDNDLLICMNNIKPYDNRYEIIRDYSFNAYEKFQDSFFDFVYIDGNHSYDAVKDDLEKWYPKLKTGGLIAGDDYTQVAEENVFDYKFGVKRAVDEFVFNKKKNVSIDLSGDWYYHSTINDTSVLYPSRNWYFFK